MARRIVQLCVLAAGLAFLAGAIYLIVEKNAEQFNNAIRHRNSNTFILQLQCDDVLVSLSQERGVVTAQLSDDFLITELDVTRIDRDYIALMSKRAAAKPIKIYLPDDGTPTLIIRRGETLVNHECEIM